MIEAVLDEVDPILVADDEPLVMANMGDEPVLSRALRAVEPDRCRLVALRPVWWWCCLREKL
jgi:hypothetical protein